MSKPIGMMIIGIEKGLLFVEATRISHVAPDNRNGKDQSAVHLKSGEEFTLAEGSDPRDLAEEYNRLAAGGTPGTMYAVKRKR